jgi:hypothetical protein
MAITINAPLKKSQFQQIDFPTLLGVTNIPYSYPSAPSAETPLVDEIIVGGIDDTDQNNIDFIKRYNTWFVYTQMEFYPVLPYSIILIKYDTTNQIAYTYSTNLIIKRKDN